MLKSIQYNDIAWVDIKNPKQTDIRYLRENFDFHELVLEELFSHGHRPKVEHHDSYLFLVLYYPSFDKKSKGTLPKELEIIATKTHLITAHTGDILPLAALFEKLQTHEESRREYMSETIGHLLFWIIRGILENTLTKLEHIEQKVEYIEDKIFRGEERKMVFEISVVKRGIIDFRRVLAPQTSVIESLALEGTQFFGPELEPHFQDLRGTFGMIWNDIEEYRETIYALSQTNESLLSTKTNEIIKVLTVFSVASLPLSLLVNIWGMNMKGMPLTESGVGFWIILGAMGVILVAMFVYFKKKKWL